MRDRITSFNQLEAPPIFIIGFARSGTTWLFDIYDNHPMVAGVLESTLFSNVVNYLMRDAQWAAQRYGLGRYIERDQMRQHARQLVELLYSYAIGPEHRYIIEKSPSHILHLNLIKEIFPEARFVHILRDGRDVVVSARAAAATWAPGWKKSFARNTFVAARRWKHAIKVASERHRQASDDFLEIRYESLRNDPFTEYRKLFDFAGIPYDDELLQAIHEATDFELNYADQDDDQFHRAGRVGDWRSYFNFIDSLIFNLIAGKLLIELGYEKNRLWMSSLFGRKITRDLR